MKGIYWLASYPKSGNTWFRIFLSNLLSGKDEPVDINNMPEIPIASNRHIFDKLIGYSSVNLTLDEIDDLRPDIYRKYARANEDAKFLKIHDAYTRLICGERLLPYDDSLAAIYFIRNPLDVAVSFAFHSRISMDEAVDKICADGLTLCGIDTVSSSQYRQIIMSWSKHVESWTQQIDIDIHVMRFEDMKNRPLETFAHAVDFLGMDDKLDRVEKAVDFSDFKITKAQEEKSGFKERPSKVKSFFREGETASWKKHLTMQHIQKIIDVNRNVMMRFGYLTGDGEIIE